ncbi:MAG: putative glutathione S-transferase [Pseudohongiellaceae bacterium]|jgi:putative glutathione S-transferase
MKKATIKTDKAWENQWYDTQASKGRFVRHDSLFRHWITRDGSPGATGIGGFTAEPGRYHLYISMACPWAHRTLITRKLKQLEEMISVSNSNSYMGPESWTFEPEQGRIFLAAGDDDEYIDHLYELYRLVDPDYADRATVPVLWDKHRQTIVSNESAEIMRMLNSEFDDLLVKEKATQASTLDLYPVALRDEIDALNEWIYPNVNNGVYRSGFATTQEAYEEAVIPLFETLDQLEEKLGSRRFLCGDKLTEADVRLFPTLVRFDSVYVSHFKCALKRIKDYPNLWGYTRDIYQLPGIADTVDIEYNKAHYYGSHDTVNPTLIIPIGPLLDFNAPHQREKLASDPSPL